MKNICFIPVRKGSKGIPQKNLRELGGKPLICWTLDTVLASGIADEVWVATDWGEMERLVYNRYAERIKVYRRSEWSARDEAFTMEVVQEFISNVNLDDNDRFILLQATSPFVRKEELQTLSDEMRKGDYNSFISCCCLKKFRWSKDGHPQDYYIFRKKPRRQEYEGILLESGAFYASTIGQIRKTGVLLSGRIRVLETNGATLIDIDDQKDWIQAENYIRDIGVTDDFYVEFYTTVDDLLQRYILSMELEQPVCTYLFQKSFPLRMEYNESRKSEFSADECKLMLEKKILPNVPKNMPEKKRVTMDYCSEIWYKTLSNLSGQLVFYVYNNRQLHYLIPLINSLNRPVLLICEPVVDGEFDVGDNVTAVNLFFADDYPVYDDALLEIYFPELYRYYNTFHLMLMALRPEGVILLEGCHYQEQILGIISCKNNIPCIGIQQGWPSFMHTMFRNFPYSHYLTWGEKLSKYWKQYNPKTDFIPTGYFYEVREEKGENITFFLQAPLFISNELYFNQLVELISETAEKYPATEIWVREHPEYELASSTIEALKRYPNVRMVSDMCIAEVFAHTQIAVAHFSSILLEGVAHDCIPMVFDPTRDSRYVPDVEQAGLGMIAYDKQSFFEKLEHILINISTFIENILAQKSGWFYGISEKAVNNTVDAISRITGCRFLNMEQTQKLHIGCGPFVMDGWLNTDIQCNSKDVRYMDAGRPYPFPDYSFEYIYSEHLFEHLGLPQAINMLKECYRILKPGGKMRLAMPNFHFLMELYLHPDKKCNRQYLEWSYCLFGKQLGQLEVMKENYPLHVINNFFHLWGHRFIHTPEHLQQMAEQVGFENVHRFPLGMSDTPTFRNIENHRNSIPEWANELETFVVEMKKPEN